MIDYPDFYPDELFYSYLSRLYVRSGFVTYRDMADYLYERKNIRPEPRFANPLKNEVRKTITSIMPWMEIAEKHTMLPQYRFIEAPMFQEAYQLVCECKSILNYTKNTKDNNHYLNYCPECAREDRGKYGETYWHRNHQIDGLHVCARHRCYLTETKIPIISKSTPTLTPAELVIPIDTNAKHCENSAMNELAEYCCDVFNGPLFFGDYPSVGDFLSYSLSEKYLTKTGANRNIEALYRDFKAFEKETDSGRDLTVEALHKIFTGKNHNYMDICMLAYFEGIPASLLISPANWEQHIPKNSIFLELAERFHLDYNMVKSIGDEVLNRYRTGKRIQRPCGRKDVQWAALDEKLLTPVKQACKELYGDGIRRPGKVMPKTIQRKLNLPEKQIEMLPKCKAEVDKWKESYPEFWARECVWAVRELGRNNVPINWKRVRELTNLDKERFYRCKVFIGNYTNEDEAEFIKSII